MLFDVLFDAILVLFYVMEETSTDPGEVSNSSETVEAISKYRKNTIKEKRIMRNG